MQMSLQSIYIKVWERVEWKMCKELQWPNETLHGSHRKRASNGPLPKALKNYINSLSQCFSRLQGDCKACENEWLRNRLKNVNKKLKSSQKTFATIKIVASQSKKCKNDWYERPKIVISWYRNNALKNVSQLFRHEILLHTKFFSRWKWRPKIGQT